MPNEPRLWNSDFQPVERGFWRHITQHEALFGWSNEESRLVKPEKATYLTRLRKIKQPITVSARQPAGNAGGRKMAVYKPCADTGAPWPNRLIRISPVRIARYAELRRKRENFVTGG